MARPRKEGREVFSIAVPSSVARELATAAELAGISRNAWILETLEKRLARNDTTKLRLERDELARRLGAIEDELKRGG